MSNEEGWIVSADASGKLLVEVENSNQQLFNKGSGKREVTLSYAAVCKRFPLLAAEAENTLRELGFYVNPVTKEVSRCQ